MANSGLTLVVSQTDPLAAGSTTKKELGKKVLNHLEGLLSGSKRGASIQVFADGAEPVRAHHTIGLATCAAGTVLEVNGVPFRAITGTAVAANDEFDIDGNDGVDATDLPRAINACDDAAISGVIGAAAVGADILTPSTAIAGNSFKVVLSDGTSHTFIGKAGAATAGGLNFSIDTSNAATCTSIAAQVNGYTPFSGKLSAAATATTVTFTSQDGNTFTLTGTATTLAESNGGRVIVRALQAGALGNGITIKTRGIRASGTATCATVVATDTLLINGAALTAIVQRATGTLTAATSVAGDTFAIDNVTFTGRAGASTVGSNHYSVDTSNNAVATDIAAQINGFNFRGLGAGGLVTATASAAVVTIRAVASGTAGNDIALAGTSVTLAASVTTLTGGIAVANDQFDVSPGSTDTQVATDLCRAITASTTALISGHVTATSSAAVVTVRAAYDGAPGNAITFASTGGTITCSVARLAGGTEASSAGAQASGTVTIAGGGSGNYTVTVNGVATGNVAWNTNENTTAADILVTLNALTSALIKDHVKFSISGAVITVTALRGGVAGNAITLACTGTGATASVSRLAGGAAPTTVVPGAERLVRGVGAAVTPVTITL